MIEIPVFDANGKEVEKLTVDATAFGGKVHKKLLRDVIVMYLANKRRGTAATKRRGEVEGSTRKPWKQKHTGRARSGTVRSPLWRKGGVIFGPQPRDFGYSMPKQMKRRALDSALLSKFEDKETKILAGFAPTAPKTKEFSKMLKALGIEGRVLVGWKTADRNAFLSARNLPRTMFLPVGDFNAYDVLNCKTLLLTKEAFEALVAARKG
ncbi:MAG: 50S ribosomal protein L4 [Planctomycetota bacterium]